MRLSCARRSPRETLNSSDPRCGARLELGAGHQPLPERGGWPATRRRPRPAGDRPRGGTPPPDNFDRIPPPFEPQADEWLCVPLHHIFGSEELSALAPAIAERITAHASCSAETTSSASDVTEGDAVRVTVGEGSHRLIVRELLSMPRVSPACLSACRRRRGSRCPREPASNGPRRRRDGTRPRHRVISSCWACC